jgi:hypothetical protein
MTHDELKALLPLAALERLEPDEIAALREHRPGCAECDAELRELEHAISMLALAVDAPTTEDRVTRKIEARLADAPPISATTTPIRDREPTRIAEPSRREGSRLAIAAAVVLAIYGAAVTSRLISLQSAYDARASQLAYLQSRFTTLEHDAQRAEQKIDALSKVLSERVRFEHVFDAPDLQVTVLSPLSPAPRAHALVAVSRASHDVVWRVSGLEAPPPGRIYEIWWITKRKGAVAAGMFTAETGKDVVAKVDPPPAGERVITCEVTLEPEGGAPRPTGVMYLKGSPERE